MSQLISIVIPCYCSEHYLANTVTEILHTFSTQKKYSCQIILVDDGSPDDTFHTIQKLSSRHSEILGIRLSKNYGQSRARMAALSHIKGSIAVFMDDDGQHSPNGIFNLADKIMDGYDLVYAKFPVQKESAFRKFASTITNHCMNAVTKKPKDLKISSFFAISTFSINALQHYHSPYIFLGGYLFEITKKITTVELSHRERSSGTSTYTLKKLYQLWLDNMLAFPQAPAHICRNIGIFTLIISCGLLLFTFFHPSVLLACTSLICLFFGILFFMLGIIGEIILRSFFILQGVPTCMIREIFTPNNKEE